MLSELKQKAIDLFFPSGKNKYGGSVDISSFTLCDATQAPFHEFRWDGTLSDYLKENGLYASTTYFYLRSKQKDISEYPNGNANDDSESQSESANNRVICDVCKCTYEEGDTCIRCEQNTEYEQSLVIGVLQYAKGNQMKWIHKVMNNNLLLLIVVLHVLMKVITTFSETDLKIWILFVNS